MDVKGLVQNVPKPIESCTQSDVELICEEVWVVSAAEPRLPLQIDDASRPESDSVSVTRRLMSVSFKVIYETMGMNFGLG